MAGAGLAELRRHARRLETVEALTARLDRLEGVIAAMTVRLQRLEAAAPTNEARNPREGEGEYDPTALIG